MQNSQSNLSINTPGASIAEPESYLSAAGKIRYTMTNDYMFNVIFQNTDILTEFLCPLLFLGRDQIHSVTIKNPLLPGNTALDKTFILDINISLNDNTLINIEMQVNNLGDWFDRSLSYLCRSFDQLYHGEKYSATKSVLHIGILDFNIFPTHPEFYSSYKLMNIKNHQIYNDKFELRVLQLNHADLAAKREKDCGLAHWAALFKSTTWEEIKMLAHEKPVFDAVAQTLYKSNADEDIRYACQIREEYAFQMRRRQEQMDDLIKRNQEQQSQIQRGQEQLDEYEFQMRRNQEQMDDLIRRNQEQQNEINALRLENKKLKGL